MTSTFLSDRNTGKPERRKTGVRLEAHTNCAEDGARVTEQRTLQGCSPRVRVRAEKSGVGTEP